VNVVLITASAAGGAAQLVECLAEARASVACIQVIEGAGEHREALVPPIVQRLGQGCRSAVVANDDRVDLQQWLADQGRRTAGTPEVLQSPSHKSVGSAVVAAASRDDNGASALADEDLDELGLAQRAVLRTCQGHYQVGALGCIGNPGSDRREVGVGNVAHDQPQRASLTPRHRLGVGVGHVLQPIGRGQEPSRRSARTVRLALPLMAGEAVASDTPASRATWLSVTGADIASA
jgi:hypothetical protein